MRDKSFGVDLSNSLSSDSLLNSHIQLTGKSDTRAVDLSQNVDIVFVVVPVQNEIGSPDQWGLFFLQSLFH